MTKLAHFHIMLSVECVPKSRLFARIPSLCFLHPKCETLLSFRAEEFMEPSSILMLMIPSMLSSSGWDRTCISALCRTLKAWKKTHQTVVLTEYKI